MDCSRLLSQDLYQKLQDVGRHFLDSTVYKQIDRAEGSDLDSVFPH